MAYDLTACGRSAMERMAGRRLMTLVADGREAIVAEFHPDDSVEAVRTDNPVIGLLATEYVKADVLGRLLIDDMGDARFEEIRYHPGRDRRAAEKLRRPSNQSAKALWKSHTIRPGATASLCNRSGPGRTAQPRLAALECRNRRRS
ncbi:hypothetical protein [Solirhodobacter olei]|uniref:hypothetical protein n=1 Tax=Solirhodobacter olei TaxID=2493082 RepID=UPI000FDB120F|nr:hypothetical protein [Solirhodobacter olei]